MQEITCKQCTPDLLPDIVMTTDITKVSPPIPYFHRRGGCYDLRDKIQQLISKYDNSGMERYKYYMDEMMSLGKNTRLQVKIGKWSTETVPMYQVAYDYTKEELMKTAGNRVGGKPMTDAFFDKHIKWTLDIEIGTDFDKERPRTKKIPQEYDTYIFNHQSLCGMRYMTHEEGIPISSNPAAACKIIDDLRKRADSLYHATVINPYLGILHD